MSGSRVTSHFFTAIPYPIARPSSAIPTAPAVSENSHQDTPSIFRSLRAWPFRLRVDSTSLRQIAPAAPPRFVARPAIPAPPPLSPHPFPGLAASFAPPPPSTRL